MPTKISYVRLWGRQLVTIPNFAAWHCDTCGYTRYDSSALSRIELLFGIDGDTLADSPRRHSQQVDGPGERGPSRWSI
jgi:YgiT-type zinc finger domain-containing protein